MTVQTDRSSKNEKSDLEDRIYLYVNFKNLKQHEMHASVNMVKVKMDLIPILFIIEVASVEGGK